VETSRLQGLKVPLEGHVVQGQQIGEQLGYQV